MKEPNEIKSSNSGISVEQARNKIKPPNIFLDASFDPPGKYHESRKINFEKPVIDQTVIVEGLIHGNGKTDPVERFRKLLNGIDLKGPKLLQGLRDGMEEVANNSSVKYSAALRNLSLATTYIEDKKIVSMRDIEKLQLGAKRAIDDLIENSCNIGTVIMLRSLSEGLPKETSLQCSYTALAIHCFTPLEAIAGSITNTFLAKPIEKLSQMLRDIEDLMAEVYAHPSIADKPKPKNEYAGRLSI